jgi:hypothetical protein
VIVAFTKGYFILYLTCSTMCQLVDQLFPIVTTTTTIVAGRLNTGSPANEKYDVFPICHSHMVLITIIITHPTGHVPTLLNEIEAMLSEYRESSNQTVTTLSQATVYTTPINPLRSIRPNSEILCLLFKDEARKKKHGGDVSITLTLTLSIRLRNQHHRLCLQFRDDSTAS